MFGGLLMFRKILYQRSEVLVKHVYWRTAHHMCKYSFFGTEHRLTSGKRTTVDHNFKMLGRPKANFEVVEMAGDGRDAECGQSRKPLADPGRWLPARYHQEWREKILSTRRLGNLAEQVL
ncbi:hypothetical protein HBI56_039790 [Parastagonospora nodorum]|uniref:Uncharacterized protein n=1 Tax=Phaeosphaeria nodorum (strain SN15 / ATCC MYA-4574 / FGSC 10173) TaxID=321614 RepID=A0A7U2EUM2_PHANO|nr:hypothetical protein HBH56_066970 [Parastagonospora nodorum]QRC93385.1 hypothetical protein JI435_429260 [Parastagonospora nodorum SN15]KAH3932267.1 hypothetical protein HBH54_081110 [Parastagonospora nodorum]KAH3955085.1 hypothetical protein HBH53_013260 [Parastagonospora nodorum]KAH3986316.1 hypothetical protein HBH52_044460 [Parastagonospora nodorum]